MKASGIILELHKKQALIMTHEAGFMAIKRKPEMFIGQQVDIGQPDLKKLNLNRHSYALGLASIAVFMSILLWVMTYSGQNRLYAYVSIDINPSMEFAVNKEIRIISVKGLNKDGIVLLRGADFTNMPLDKALMMIVNKAEQNQYFHNRNGKYVFIAAAVKTESLKKPRLLAKSIQKVEQQLKKRDIHLQFIQTSLAQRRTALQNDLSTGRYILSNAAAHNGQTVNRNRAKAAPISVLMKQAGLIKKPKAGAVVHHKRFHHSAAGSKAKSHTGNKNSTGIDSNRNDGRKGKNERDAHIDHSKVKGNSPGSGNGNRKSNLGSPGFNSHFGKSGSTNNAHGHSHQR
jgi:hypothetical protein